MFLLVCYIAAVFDKLKRKRRNQDMDLKLLLAITLNFVEINGARREGRISSRSKSSLCHGSNVNRRIEQRPHQRQFSQRFRALENLRSFCTELAFHIFRYSVIGGKTQVTN